MESTSSGHFSRPTYRCMYGSVTSREPGNWLVSEEKSSNDRSQNFARLPSVCLVPPVSFLSQRQLHSRERGTRTRILVTPLYSCRASTATDGVESNRISARTLVYPIPACARPLEISPSAGYLAGSFPFPPIHAYLAFRLYFPYYLLFFLFCSYFLFFIALKIARSYTSRLQLTFIEPATTSRLCFFSFLPLFYIFYPPPTEHHCIARCLLLSLFLSIDGPITMHASFLSGLPIFLSRILGDWGDFFPLSSSYCYGDGPFVGIEENFLGCTRRRRIRAWLIFFA